MKQIKNESLPEFLDFMYPDEDLVCIFFNPPFQNIRQRFTKIVDLKTERWQRFLRAANAHGSNIYLSVYSFKGFKRTEKNVVDNINRIFLDFDDAEAYKHFKSDYKSTVAVKTSPGKFQCFLMLSNPAPKHLVKHIGKTLARKYGADHCFDLARVFRLPGFRNYKYPEHPLTRVVEFNLCQLYSTNDLPCETKELKNATKKVERDNDGNSQTYKKYSYAHFRSMAPLKASGEPDYSQADLSYSIFLFGLGFNNQQVKDALLNESPSLLNRKKGGIDNYLNKTINKAMAYQQNHYRPYQEASCNQ